MSLLAKLKYGALAVLTFLGGLLFTLLGRERKRRREAERKAEQEQHARETVTDAHERNKQITDGIRLSDAAERRERLRKHATPRRDD